jgi:hypothetical protein
MPDPTIDFDPATIHRCPHCHADLDEEHISLGAMGAAADNVWISVMSPAVAAPLATWLEQEAQTCEVDVAVFESAGRRARGHGAGGRGMDDLLTEKYLHKRYGAALAVTRSILQQP